MNETPKQYLLVGAEVTYIGADKKSHQAKVTQVYNATTARLESAEGHIAIAQYSETREVNTFSFPVSAAASVETEKHSKRQ